MESPIFHIILNAILGGISGFGTGKALSGGDMGSTKNAVIGALGGIVSGTFLGENGFHDQNPILPSVLWSAIGGGVFQTVIGRCTPGFQALKDVLSGK